MVDVLMMQSSLDAVPNGAAMLIVGDIGRLPSVGLGHALADVVESRSVPVVQLTEGHRCAKGVKARLPLSPDGLIPGLCDRDAERGVTLQDGGADLEFSDLAVEVARHEGLPQQLHAMHLRLARLRR